MGVPALVSALKSASVADVGSVTESGVGGRGRRPRRGMEAAAAASVEQPSSATRPNVGMVSAAALLERVNLSLVRCREARRSSRRKFERGRGLLKLPRKLERGRESSSCVFFVGRQRKKKEEKRSSLLLTLFLRLFPQPSLFLLLLLLLE